EMNGGTITATSQGIYTSTPNHIMTMTGGTVTSTGSHGFDYAYNGNPMSVFNMSGGTIIGASRGANLNGTTINMTGGEIQTTGYGQGYYAVYINGYSGGTFTNGAFINAPRGSGIWATNIVNLTDTTIFAGAQNAYGIYTNGSAIYLHEGTLINTPGSSANGILFPSNSYSFEVVVDGAEIKSGNIGINSSSQNTSRTIKVLDGKVYGENYGVYLNAANVTLNVGTLEQDFSTNNPIISGGMYGVYRVSGTANFYNGRLRGYTYGYNSLSNVRPGMDIAAEAEDIEEVKKYLTYSTTNVSSTPISQYAKTGTGYAIITYIDETNDLCENGQEFLFDYTGSEQVFSVPCSGKFSLEVWGGAGAGDQSATGGRGGYAYGEIELEYGEKLYVNTGGTGNTNDTYAYNGGGFGRGSGSGYAAGGGGATHIALVSGEIQTLSSKRDQILIVAGGGGGASDYAGNDGGGSGGGWIGGTGYGSYGGKGGNQETGYLFGRGQEARYQGAGGGGGWYGGYQVGTDSTGHGGGGGSGYIGHERITNGVMYGYKVQATTGTWINNYYVDKEAFLQVGDQTFNRFDDASAAIEENGEGTIIVLKDAKILEVPTIVGNRTITLDLNGHKIETMRRIVNNSKLTIVDSSELKTGELYAIEDNVIETLNDLTLDGVKASSHQTDYSAIYCTTNSLTVEVKNSTINAELHGITSTYGQSVVVENSTITAKSSGIKMGAAGSNVTFKSGTINASDHGIYFENAPRSTATFETGIITATNNGIYFNNSANSSLTYKDGEMTIGNNGIQFNNSGSSSLTYKQGTITSTGNAGFVISSSNNSTVHIENSTVTAYQEAIYNSAQAVTWVIDNATMTSTAKVAVDFVNTSTSRSSLTIKDGTYTGTTHGARIRGTNAIINGGTFTTTSTDRDNYAFVVESNGILTVNEGVVITAPNASGIYADCPVTLNKTSVTSGSLTGYGIYHKSSNLNITDTAITGNNGIESTSDNNYTINYTNSTIDATNVGIYMNGTGTKTLNINSGTIDGEVIGLLLKGNNTTTNLGIKDEVLSIENPHIISDNIAIMNNFGNLNFYSGLLTATSRVLTTEPNELRKDKEVHYDYTINEGEVATLTSFSHSSSATSNYAKEGNGYAKLKYLEYDGSLPTISNSEPTIISEYNCNIHVGDTFDYPYTGSFQEFVPTCDGEYKLEVWGARGGQGADSNVSNTGWSYGKGGYSVGNIKLTDSDTLYIYAGGTGVGVNGQTVTKNAVVPGGFNGGGNTYHDGGEFGGSGGGASDVRVNSNSLYARVIVAGGGGGSGEDNETAGTAGGTQSVNSYNSSYTATQTGAGSGGSFGQGANYQNTGESGGGGGGGWYGGGGGQGSGSGGGSGYVYTAETALNYPTGCLLSEKYYLTEASTIAGNQSFTSPTGTSETGHAGSGYVRITYLSSSSGSGSTGNVLVELDAREGTLNTTSITNRVGTAIGELPIPSAPTGYVFDGWYTNLEFNEKVNEDTVVNYHLKLYAKYKADSVDCSTIIDKEYLFDYSGQSEQFVAYCPGKYKVEVWGASGGAYSPNTKYGYGGYSTGEIILSKDETIYVTVGGQGDSTCQGNFCKGGFNGGGFGIVASQSGSGGGGATHIAKASGQLYDLNENRSSVLIVAGGGGGSGASGIGGSGGGYIGGDGLDSYNNNGYSGYAGSGGTETTGGKTFNNSTCDTGTFGKGAGMCNESAGGSGAGGGYFGGGGSNRGHGGAGGGSGYINESQVTNGQMYGYNVPSRGHGIINAYLSSKQGFLEVDGNVYNSFETALGALGENGGTIKVLNHASVQEDVTFPSEKTITLDMNGYELSFIKTIVNESTLTIKNDKTSKSTITNTTGDVINNKGTITINNVDIVSGASSSCIRGTTGNGTITV
ncbi:MAG: InlB B-repeat-containing protein, partial [Bacilli bacterium]|nr:InlB B-repeat-containing protein [Bacilli bacterium]